FVVSTASAHASRANVDRRILSALSFHLISEPQADPHPSWRYSGVRILRRGRARRGPFRAATGRRRPVLRRAGRRSPGTVIRITARSDGIPEELRVCGASGAEQTENRRDSTPLALAYRVHLVLLPFAARRHPRRRVLVRTDTSATKVVAVEDCGCSLDFDEGIKLAMSNKEAEKSPRDAAREDPLGDTGGLIAHVVPAGGDRGSFLRRAAVGGAAAVMTGCSAPPEERTAKAAATAQPAAPPSTPPLAADLNVVQQEKGPVLTTVDEFYKVGPGPSSSHTIGPMRITYDFYHRATKLPPDKLPTPP